MTGYDRLLHYCLHHYGGRNVLERVPTPLGGRGATSCAAPLHLRRLGNIPAWVEGLTANISSYTFIRTYPNLLSYKYIDK